MKLPVSERFYTFQGEGVHMGRSAFFIRLHGCPIHCPWCDSAGTWHPTYVPKNIERIETEVLATEARRTGAEFVVVTGGEPTIHDLSELTSRLMVAGDKRPDDRVMPCHLETTGAFPIRGDFAFITISPKREKLPLRENLMQANEIKLIIDSVAALDEWHDYMVANYFEDANPNWNVWLHPEWSQRGDKILLDAITDQVKKYPRFYRAGYQMHKLYLSDALDKRSRAPVPLGGNPELGY